MRLNKAIADAGVCSRRKADELIFAQKVKVNGLMCDNPATQVDIEQDSLEVDGKKINLKTDSDFCYLMLYKPTEVLTTVSDPEGRPTVMDFIPEAYKNKRLYPVGRLDYFSEGLVLLTDDGNLANKLMHPSHNQDRIYQVMVREEVTSQMINIMQKGMVLSDREKLAPVKVKVLNVLERGTWLELTLTQGVNRQIRRMCKDFNLTILKLKRISHGKLNLGDLTKGECRLLTKKEVKEL